MAKGERGEGRPGCGPGGLAQTEVVTFPTVNVRPISWHRSKHTSQGSPRAPPPWTSTSGYPSPPTPQGRIDPGSWTLNWAPQLGGSSSKLTPQLPATSTGASFPVMIRCSASVQLPRPPPPPDPPARPQLPALPLEPPFAPEKPPAPEEPPGGLPGRGGGVVLPGGGGRDGDETGGDIEVAITLGLGRRSSRRRRGRFLAAEQMTPTSTPAPADVLKSNTQPDGGTSPESTSSVSNTDEEEPVDPIWVSSNTTLWGHPTAPTVLHTGGLSRALHLPPSTCIALRRLVLSGLAAGRHVPLAGWGLDAPPPRPPEPPAEPPAPPPDAPGPDVPDDGLGIGIGIGFAGGVGDGTGAGTDDTADGSTAVGEGGGVQGRRRQRRRALQAVGNDGATLQGLAVLDRGQGSLPGEQQRLEGGGRVGGLPQEAVGLGLGLGGSGVRGLMQDGGAATSPAAPGGPPSPPARGGPQEAGEVLPSGTEQWLPAAVLLLFDFDRQVREGRPAFWA